MIVEALENYAKVTSPWLQACNAANAMSISATRIVLGQMELAALTTRFMNERLCASASFDGGVEPLVHRLEKLTDQYSESYVAQLKTIYAPWSDLLHEDRSLADVLSMTADRDDAKEAKEAKEGKRHGGPREVRPEKGREPAAH